MIHENLVSSCRNLSLQAIIKKNVLTWILSISDPSGKHLKVGLRRQLNIFGYSNLTLDHHPRPQTRRLRLRAFEICDDAVECPVPNRARARHPLKIYDFFYHKYQFKLTRWIVKKKWWISCLCNFAILPINNLLSVILIFDSNERAVTKNPPTLLLM